MVGQPAPNRIGEGRRRVGTDQGGRIPLNAKFDAWDEQDRWALSFIIAMAVVIASAIVVWAVLATIENPREALTVYASIAAFAALTGVIRWIMGKR